MEIEQNQRQTQIRSAQVVYIAGSGRSGSSLLDVLLNNHSKITGTGEIHRISLDPYNRLCSCEETIAKCHYWQNIVSEYARLLGVQKSYGVWENHSVTVVKTKTNKIPGLTEILLFLGSQFLFKKMASIIPHTKQYYRASLNSWFLFDAIAAVNNTEWIVDSTKNPVRLKFLYSLRPKNFKVIHLVRDGRAVAASTMRREGKAMCEASAGWVRANKNVLYMLKTIPSEQKLLLRYEDLCDNTEQELKRLMNFLQISYENLVSPLGNQQFHTIPGNPMLFDRIRKIVKDERWKQELTQSDLDNFAKSSGNLNKMFGYD